MTEEELSGVSNFQKAIVKTMSDINVPKVPYHIQA